MEEKLNSIKEQIVTILSHPEAEEGLYFRNFFLLHEEDDRPALEAPEDDALAALSELVGEGKILLGQSRGEIVFQIADQRPFCASARENFVDLIVDVDLDERDTFRSLPSTTLLSSTITTTSTIT